MSFRKKQPRRKAKMFSSEAEEDLPDIKPGEVVHNENGDLAYTVLKQVCGLDQNAENVKTN